MFDWHPASRPMAAATIRVSVLALMLASLSACASGNGDDQLNASSESPTTSAGSAASVPVTVTSTDSKHGSLQAAAIPLKGTKWKLNAASISSIDLAKFDITIEFAADKVSGFAGVNRYNGSYETQADGSIEFGPLATTKMAGPPEAMAAEAAYLKALQEASHYSADKAELTLVDPVGVTLEYRAAK